MNFPVISIFIAFAMCNMCKSEDEWKTVIEGASVHLHFPYPCNSTRVTLQYGIRVPFYALADTESISLPPLQVHRFNFRKKREQDHCSLHVSINPVMRIDAGIYIFFTYSEDGMHFESFFKRTRLHVDIPPGKASCTLNEESTVGNWVALNCMAPVGTVSGQIDCFQRGDKMLPITEPSETHTHLKQSIHVNMKHPVFCCTSSREHTKDFCDCNDFQLDLAKDKNLTAVIDPCGPTTSPHDIIETSETASNSSNPVSTTATTTMEINYSDGSVIWKYGFLVLSSIVIIGSVMLGIGAMLRSRKLKEISLTYKYKFTSRQDQSIPQFYEPILNPNVHRGPNQRSISI